MSKKVTFHARKDLKYGKLSKNVFTNMLKCGIPKI